MECSSARQCDGRSWGHYLGLHDKHDKHETHETRGRDRLSQRGWLRSSLRIASRSDGRSHVNSDPVPITGMAKAEARRVQERTLQLRERRQMRRKVTPLAAVERVADHRVADGAEVHPDLMRAASGEGHAEKGDPPQMLGLGDSRHGTPRAARARRHPLTMYWVATEGASIRRPACTRPHTNATYSFSTSRASNCRASSACDASCLAPHEP